MSLENKVAIVTGGARGIGFAIAKRFVSDGAKVVVADIDDAAGEETVEDLGSLGDVTYIHCNVGERLDVRNMVAETLNGYGDIDILVNNAGIVGGADFLELEEEDFDRILAVNSFGTKTVLLISVWNFLIGRPEFIDLALIYAMMNFIGTIAVLRYSSPRQVSLLEGSLDDPHGIDAVTDDDDTVEGRA